MSVWRAAWVVARRDFVSLVATPTFLFFLLAPLIMMVLSTIGGMSAGHIASNAGSRDFMVAIIPEREVPALVAADARMRAVDQSPAGPPRLMVLPDVSVHRAVIQNYRDDPDMVALMTGTLAHPLIAERSADDGSGRYLAALAEGVMREGVDRAAAPTNASQPQFSRIPGAGGSSSAVRTGLGNAVVFAIFLLMLLLAGQTVGMLAEEKGNKVIEILAAAVPLEGVFVGKLVGMVGIAILFVGFWLGVGAVGGAMLAHQDGLLGQWTTIVAPAVGWPMFVLLLFLYFLAQFMLLGGMFLGVGAQASTVREIQMLSLPITFLQIGMFALASSAANAPGSRIAHIAELVPWSSPMAMAARAASDAALWPHVAALLWQALWIAITIWVSVRVFRAGVLRSGVGGWWRARRSASPPSR